VRVEREGTEPFSRRDPRLSRDHRCTVPERKNALHGPAQKRRKRSEKKGKSDKEAQRVRIPDQPKKRLKGKPIRQGDKRSRNHYARPGQRNRGSELEKRKEIKRQRKPKKMPLTWFEPSRPCCTREGGVLGTKAKGPEKKTPACWDGEKRKKRHRTSLMHGAFAGRAATWGPSERENLGKMGE